MALLHAQAGEVVDAGPLGDLLPETKTCALVKTQNFEVIRMGDRHRRPKKFFARNLAAEDQAFACGSNWPQERRSSTATESHRPGATDIESDIGNKVTSLALVTRKMGPGECDG